MTEPWQRFRMDFVIEVVASDEDTREITLRLTPDPARYEWRDVRGVRYLFDKLDDVLISQDELAKTGEQMAGLPIYAQDPLIEDTDTYVEERIPVIADALDAKERKPTFVDPSEAFLRSLARRGHDFAIMSLDIVGSTVLSGQLESDTYARVMTVTATELSEVVALFRGHVLKYTGDGLIAYFPAPSFILKNDLALDAALAMRKLVYWGLNRVFDARGLRKLAVRIGIDSGRASVVTIGSPETKQQSDLLGEVVSLACKIQSRVGAGGIALGDEAVRGLHVTWRRICEPLDPGPNWAYLRDGKPYPIHQVRLGDEGTDTAVPRPRLLAS